MPVPKNKPRRLPSSCLRAFVVLIALPLCAQTKPAEENVQIIPPAVDKAAGQITLPAAFWNQKLCDWVETAVCGRPSDFLHETILSITTTRTLLEKSLRDIGCRDADAWTDSVRDFPRIRGDRLLILVNITREGKTESYPLDELFEFTGWGTPIGPYGWMFKGDPKDPMQPPPPSTPSLIPPPQTLPGDTDATRILRDDPQFALVFKGIQSVSQSCVDHPLAYQDWIYPFPDFHRNDQLLPDAVYDSNGAVPATLTIRKVTDEQFLSETAKAWHDDAFRQYILQQIPLAQQIDKDKAELLNLRQQSRQNRTPETAQRLKLLAASIDKNYTALDNAWAQWGVDHAHFDASDDRALAALKRGAALWKEFMALEKTRTEQLYLAESAAFQSHQIESASPTPPNPGDPTKARLQKLRGQEIEARAAALQAENAQPLDRWKAEHARIDPKDPRADYIKNVALQVELTAAKSLAAQAGIAYGHALAQDTPPPDFPALQSRYAAATLQVAIADARLQLAEIDFEISKREDFPNDEMLPELRKQKQQLESRLKELQAATQPATQGGND